ncbi:unnamed protein product [Brachionus calyciflorus]|uniref:Small ribosomal subunit protein uS7 domain-containing protein n=1 Tax=Brachionus calyciflorus TaxID=104777 RepID=A0A814C7S7_9BILA|nr:unnamed protein product [Brachionus calyciflorus]
MWASGLVNLERLSCLILSRSYARRANYLQPIVNKSDLDTVDSEDPRHYKLIKSPDGYESNAISYNSRIHKFSKILMKNGNSYLSRSLLDQTLYSIKLKQIEKFNKTEDGNKKKEIETNPRKIFLGAMDNTKPILKVVGIVKSGISYQVPVPMSEKEREFKATKLIISSCQDKDNKSRFYDILAQELIDAFNNQGKSIKKKIDIHKLAEANRAYAHYRCYSDATKIQPIQTTYPQTKSINNQDIKTLDTILKGFAGGSEFHFDCYVKDIEILEDDDFYKVYKKCGARAFRNKKLIEKKLKLNDLSLDVNKVVVLVTIESRVDFSFVKSFMIHKRNIFKEFTNADFTLKRNRFDGFRKSIKFYYLCTNHLKSELCRDNKLKTSYYLDKNMFIVEWNRNSCIC